MAKRWTRPEDFAPKSELKLTIKHISIMDLIEAMEPGPAIDPMKVTIEAAIKNEERFAQLIQTLYARTKEVMPNPHSAVEVYTSLLAVIIAKSMSKENQTVQVMEESIEDIGKALRNVLKRYWNLP